MGFQLKKVFAYLLFSLPESDSFVSLHVFPLGPGQDQRSCLKAQDGKQTPKSRQGLCSGGSPSLSSISMSDIVAGLDN